MNYISEDPRITRPLETWARSRGTNRVLTPRFFLWNTGETMQKTSVGLLRSMLYQILDELPELIPSRVKNRPLSTWTELSLRRLLEDVMSVHSSSYSVCFFVDGLDELGGDQERLISLCYELMQRFHLKIVLSSRSHKIYEVAFGTGTALRLQDFTENDIREFVVDSFTSSPKIPTEISQQEVLISDQRLHHLVDSIVRSSAGVFLWVDLAVKDLLRGLDNGDTLEQLQERVETLPNELEELYAHILNKIDRVYRKEVALWLQYKIYIESKLSGVTDDIFTTKIVDLSLLTRKSLGNELDPFDDEYPWQDVMDNCSRT